MNRKMFDETGDEEKSQGWTALIMDTNGNGRRDAYVEPNQPVDPTKDKRFGAAFYSVAPAPDGPIWGTVLGYRARSFDCTRDRIRPRRRSRKCMNRPSTTRCARASRRAAATSIAMA